MAGAKKRVRTPVASKGSDSKADKPLFDPAQPDLAVGAADEGDEESSSYEEDSEAGLESSSEDADDDAGEDGESSDEDDEDGEDGEGFTQLVDNGIVDKDAVPSTTSDWIEYCDEGDNLAEESDSTDDEGMKNRIGDVPLEWYDGYDHIGYDVTGKAIKRKPKEDGLDAWIARQDDPNFNRTIYDKLNDTKVVLTDEEVSMIHRIRHGTYAHKEFDPEDEQFYYDYSATKRIGVVGNAIEPKRRFIPSKWEAKKIVKLVHAIRNGWIKAPGKEEEEEQDPLVNTNYLLWKDDEEVEERHRKMPPAIPPPKMALPGHKDSYNPPPEYLPTAEEREQWENMDPEDRPTTYLPQKFDSLRTVPAYQDFIKERFERCLDLYLCPRVRRKRLNIDPESLVPKLPKPQDLKPFPSALCIEYIGHKGKIRSFSIDPRGQYVASGSDDGTVKLWEIQSGRCFKTWSFGTVIEMVQWNPNPSIPLLAVAVASKVFLIDTETGSQDEKDALDIMLGEAKATAQAAARAEQEEDVGEGKKRGKKKAKKMNAKWNIIAAIPGEEGLLPEEEPVEEEVDEGAEEPDSDDETPLSKQCASDDFDAYRVKLDIGRRVTHITWHRNGDYFATVSPQSSATAVLIHRLSRSMSNSPFNKSKGLVQRVMFHPIKPFFLVVSQRSVRVYDLPTQKLIKKLKCPAKWISSIDIHPSGDHVIVGSYDRRVCWYDLDLGDTPYKTLKYHKKAVRSVAYHRTFPLFATASDDGNVHVFHGMVYNDLLTNPLMVPVKLLKIQAPTKTGLGVMCCEFHPSQPWLMTSGSDHKMRLYS